MERARWIWGPRTDSFVAWCWVPLFLVAWTVAEDADATNALLLAAFGLWFIHQPSPSRWYEGAMGIALLTAGGLHVFYDGFIWNLRRAAVADSLGLPRTPVPTRG